MKNLNELGVQEMDALEMKEKNGGLGFLATVLAGSAIAAVAAVINDWDNFERGLCGEPCKQ